MIVLSFSCPCHPPFKPTWRSFFFPTRRADAHPISFLPLSPSRLALLLSLVLCERRTATSQPSSVGRSISLNEAFLRLRWASGQMWGLS